MTEILGFTAEHVSKLTGLTKRQITYWDKTDFFSPEYLGGGRTYSRVYTFRDLVGLRTIAVLRLKHDIPLQELRRVGEWLHARFQMPWAKLRFGLAGKTVVFFDPETGIPTEAKGEGQRVLEVRMDLIAKEMDEAAKGLHDRSDKIGRIVKQRQVVRSAAIIEGTRIRTAAIWHFHEAGYSTEGILAEYPRLVAEDIHAAIEFEKNQRSAA